MKINIAPVQATQWVAIIFALLMLSVAATGVTAAESPPEGAQVLRLTVHPDKIELTDKYCYSQLLVTAQLANGDSIDVTRMAQYAAPANLAQVSASGLVRPLADGAGAIDIALGDKKAQTSIVNSNFAAPFEASFVGRVMPVMSKLGCNAGTCHGSLNGKNGFKLSLRGYDPLYDHRALTDDISGRRFNRAAPELSLMLLKPAGLIPHAGGALTAPGEANYEILRSWIASGAKLDLDAPRVTSIEIEPKNPVVPLPDMTRQMKVLATYADGRVRDVTLEAFIDSGNTEVAESSKTGLIKLIRRGEAPMLARFEGAYTATTITVMGDRAGFVETPEVANNYIDELVAAKLRRIKAAPSELCGDADFIRRVYLDLTGLPPKPDDVTAFLADARDPKTKRDDLVDRLVGCNEYVEHWSNKWAELLQVNRKFLGEEGAFALRGWIKQAVAVNMPYDQFVYSVLTASGSNVENPPAAYFKVLRTPEDAMENTTQLFLAVRFNCNKCHDHPFERWTQNQYYSLAAYFAQIGRKEDPTSMGRKLGGTDVEAAVPLIEDIFDTGSGEEKNAGTGKVAPPRFPYLFLDPAAGQSDPQDTASRRVQLARWMTDRDNPYFAKSYVNRLWGYLFGIGIIEPIDDIRAGNPPTNPELLDRLTREFLQSKFDMRHMLRTICKSRAYQRSIVANRWNADDETNFSHAIARRLPAEVLYDTLQQATGAESHLPGVPAGFRAAQLPDVGLTLPSGFFEIFGRPVRESACECERSSGMMLGPVMALVNGPTVAEAIADPGNAITRLVNEEKDDRKLVDSLFMRILNRPASDKEVSTGVAALQGSDEELVAAQAELAAHEAKLDADQAAWEAGQGPVEWTALDAIELKSNAGATMTKEGDLSVVVFGPIGKDLYSVSADAPLKKITGLRIEALSDQRLPNSGPGRAPNGNFVLSEVRLSAAPQSEPSKAVEIGLQNGSADFSQQGFEASGAIDGNPGSGWAVDPQTGKSHFATWETKQDVDLTGPTRLFITLDQQYSDGLHELGRFRVSVTGSAKPLGAGGLPAAIIAALKQPAAERTPAQAGELRAFYRLLDTDYAALKGRVDSLAAQGSNKRLSGAQDLAWALINSPAFLFNR